MTEQPPLAPEDNSAPFPPREGAAGAFEDTPGSPAPPGSGIEENDELPEEEPEASFSDDSGEADGEREGGGGGQGVRGAWVVRPWRTLKPWSLWFGFTRPIRVVEGRWSLSVAAPVSH